MEIASVVSAEKCSPSQEFTAGWSPLKGLEVRFSRDYFVPPENASYVILRKKITDTHYYIILRMYLYTRGYQEEMYPMLHSGYLW